MVVKVIFLQILFCCLQWSTLQKSTTKGEASRYNYDISVRTDLLEDIHNFYKLKFVQDHNNGQFW